MLFASAVAANTEIGGRLWKDAEDAGRLKCHAVSIFSPSASSGVWMYGLRSSRVWTDRPPCGSPFRGRDQMV